MPSYGRIINGNYYMALSDNNNLKKVSLEDNIYFCTYKVKMLAAT